MTEIDMIPIRKTDPEAQTVLTFPDDTQGPLVKGTGDVTFRCGRCKRALLEQVGSEQYRQVTFRCPGCATYNAVPGSPHLVEQNKRAIRPAGLSTLFTIRSRK